MIKTTELSKKEIVNNLLNMGYSEQMIALAMKDSKTQTMDEILDLLTFREKQYKAAMISGTGKPKSNSTKEDSKSQVTEENQGKGESKNPIKNEKKKDEAQLPAAMDEKASNALVDMTKSITNLHPKYIKDPNWQLDHISELLKDLIFQNTNAGKEVYPYMISHEYYPQVVDFKNKIFDSLVKMITSKPKKNGSVLDLGLFEAVLTNALEINLLGKKQMENLLTNYCKLCTKIGFKVNAELAEKIEKYSAKPAEAGIDDDEVVSDEEEDKESPKSLEGESQPLSNNPFNILQDAQQENEEDLNDPDKLKLEKKDSKTVKKIEIPSEKDVCIVCMEKTREMVFLPCSHFLTCLLCAQKLEKCPICTKAIQKTMRIFWG